MNEFGNIKKHWGNIGGSYEDFWKSWAHKNLAEREAQFIKSYLPSSPIKALDFGIGSGRILNTILENTNSQSEIYGVDAAEEMVKYCRQKYQADKKVKELKVINTIEDLDFAGVKFNFITAIRALKYNPNWKEILLRLFEILEPGGVIVCTMPRKYLLAGLFRSSIPYFRAGIKEVKDIAAQNGMKNIGIKGFARIPEIFYSINGKLFSDIVLFSEHILELIFGNTLFAREVFYVFRK